MLLLKQIGGECDSKEWGARLDEFVWIILSIINLEGITGEEMFVATVSTVDISNEVQIKNACGWMESNPPEESIASALFEYGYSDRENSWNSPCAMTAMLEARKYIAERFG